MKRFTTCTVLVEALFFLSTVGQATEIDFTMVGSPNNLADSTGYGSVDHAYKIGKYEITTSQYTEFLNAVAATDPYGLYHMDMWTHYSGCRIQRHGDPDSYSYTVDANRANRPVNRISFWDAARFANWLHNGQPTGMPDSTTTEDGAYALDGYAGTDGRTIAHNPEARFWIPTEDEWYKAAYYDPDAGAYYDYATGTDVRPSHAIITPDLGNNANFPYPGGDFNPGYPFYTTEVGEFENSASPYGTFDQTGNVREWSETIYSTNDTTASRCIRGGSFNLGWIDVMDGRNQGPPTDQSGNIGFRIATVPEPSTLMLLGTGGLLCYALKRRRKHAAGVQ